MLYESKETTELRHLIKRRLKMEAEVFVIDTVDEGYRVILHLSCPRVGFEFAVVSPTRSLRSDDEFVESLLNEFRSVIETYIAKQNEETQ